MTVTRRDLVALYKTDHGIEEMRAEMCPIMAVPMSLEDYAFLKLYALMKDWLAERIQAAAAGRSTDGMADS